MKRWPKGLFLALCVASWLGCSAERKLSHVEPREILSRPRTEERQPASARARLLQPLAFSSRCPAGLRDNLPLLSEERVNFPECPGKLEATIESARDSLSLEEITAGDALLLSRCRVHPRDGLGEVLERFINEPGQGKTVANREGDGAGEKQELLPQRDAFRAALVQMKEAANPVSNWIRNYGDFVIPKEQLDLMKKIVQQHSCKIPDSEVDATYRALRPLEELVGLLPPSDPQRLKMDGLLRGMKQMIDRKVQEYFRR